MKTKDNVDANLPQAFGYKQAVVLRADLRMSCGKAAVQACHGAVSACEEAKKQRPSWFWSWKRKP
jgi:PTH2 family peptidyl-tRNA hydrolase